MEDILSDFLSETAKTLEAVDAELADFERSPDNAEILGHIFRLVHTVKGACGFLRLRRLEALAHAAESTIERLRDGAPVTVEAVAAILCAIDRIKQIVAALEAEGAEPAGNDCELIGRLEAVAAAPGAAVPDGDTAAAGDHSRDLSGRRPPARRRRSERHDGGVRVEHATLDRLTTLASDLEFVQMQLEQAMRVVDAETMRAPMRRLAMLTRELRREALQARMRPVGSFWRSLPRLVRNLGRDLGKPVRLKLNGCKIRVDRQMLELIRDPVIHILRNCAGHGLETAPERRAAGKRETGTIRLSARREGGDLVIDIADDGRGLDKDRIRARAVQMGLAGETEIAAMTASELQAFIFRPGFSTAEQVTGLSGRGVGLDVVRANLERLGGAVEVSSRPGQGTTFFLRIPAARAGVAERPRLLLVDDSAFFRTMLEPLLAGAGFDVTAATSALEVLALRARGGCFDLVVSDVDMPGMDGFALARTLAGEEGWAEVPLIALINDASRLADCRARAAGFRETVAKFDRERLIRAAREAVNVRQAA